MEDINEEVNEVNEVIEENIVNNNEEFTNSLQKPKKPRTEKQIEALKKAQIKRKENFEKRKKEKETAKEFITNNENELKQKALDKPKPKKKPTKVIYQQPSDSESSEEEIIYIKPKKKPKKKKKKVVIQESSSESESSSSEEESGGANFIYEPAPTPKPRRALRYSDVFRFS